MRLSKYSLEYVFVPVEGPTTVTLSGLSHEIAVVAEGTDVESGDWKAATWDADEEQPRILVRASTSAPTGSPDVTLSAGRFDVWWRATSNPEVPARHAGTIEVV